MIRPLVICAALLAAATFGSAAAPAKTPAKPPAAIVAFDKAWSRVKTYNATIAVFERQGMQTQSTTLDFSFAQPSKIEVRVLAGANKGARLEWGGGDTVLVRRGSGLLSLMKKTVSLHDSLVTTIRGSAITQLGFGQILEHTRQPGVLTQTHGDVIEGVATEKVTLIPTHPLADGRLTREVIELSTTTHLPTRVLGFEGTTLVRTIDFRNIRIGQ